MKGHLRQTSTPE